MHGIVLLVAHKALADLRHSVVQAIECAHSWSAGEPARLLLGCVAITDVHLLQAAELGQLGRELLQLARGQPEILHMVRAGVGSPLAYMGYDDWYVTGLMQCTSS